MRVTEHPETYSDLIESRQKQTERDVQENIRILEESGLKFTVHNNGLHYRVYGVDMMYNYWPTKDKWSADKDQKKVYYGIHRLISTATRPYTGKAL